MSWKKGEAPWEKQSPTSFKKGSAPWESAKADQVIGQYADTISPTQEMPDWLSSGDRMVATNFAQSPAKQAEYLKLKYPDKEFTTNANKQVLARSPGEKNWKVLDPDTGFFSKDILHDAGDLAYDVPSSVAQGVATSGGAALGALAGGGGALPGAIAASAASSAGSEALRQKIGQYLGIPQEVDPTDVGMAAAAGAGSTALFGAGKAAPGLVQAGYEGAKDVGRGLTSFISGIDSDLLKKYGERSAEVDGLKSVTPLALSIGNRAEDWANKRLDQNGTALAQRMSETNLPIDISGAKSTYQNRINELQSLNERHALTPAGMDEMQSLQGQLRKYFGMANPKAPDEASVMADPQLKSLYGQLDNTIGQSTLNNPAQVAQQVESSVLSQKPAQALPPPTSNWGRQEILQSTAPDRNAQPVSQALSGFFGDTNNEIMGHAGLLREEQDALAKAYASKNQSSIDSVLNQIKLRRGDVIQDNTQTMMPDKMNAMDVWQGIQQRLRNPAKFDKNVTQEEERQARSAWGEINKSFNSASGGEIGALKSNYADAIDQRNVLQSKFGGNARNEVDRAQSVLNTVRSMDKPGRRALSEELQNMESQGLDVGKDVELLQLHDAFNNPSNNQMRKVPLAAALASLMGWGGYKAGGMPGGATGFMTGTYLGNELASPEMIKRGIKATKALEMTAKNLGTMGGRVSEDIPFYLLPNALSNQAGQGVWDQVK